MAVKPPLIPRADTSILDPDTGNLAKPWYLALAHLFRQAATSAADPLRLSFPGTPGQVGVAYSAGAAAAGGIAPYTFSIFAGALPASVSLNAATGVISGTPTVAGTASFTLRVTDAAAATANVATSINVAAAAVAAAPNVASATCTVTLQRWSNTTLPVFGGTFTLPGSVGALAVVEVWVILASGKRVQIARYDSGLTAGAVIAYSGYDSQILQTAASQNVSVAFIAYNTESTPTAAPLTLSPVVIPAAGITSYSVTDNVAARWSVKGGTSALQAVCPNTISCASYPQVVTIWSVSPQYGRIWHKWYEIDGPATIISIGGQGTDTSIFPPTVAASEVVRFGAAIGAHGSDEDPTTITGAVFYDVTIAGPATPGATDATAWYVTSATPTYATGPGGASLFGWTISGKLPITASDTPDKFWSARLCIQTGKYVAGVWTPGGQRPNTPSPTDPSTVVGDYAGPTDWYSVQDHADNVKGDPATGLITWANPNLWTVPSDGFVIFRFVLFIQSRRSGGTWVQQDCWSAAAGTATPGTNAFQELTVDGSKSAITSIVITTANGQVTIDPAGLGLLVEDGLGNFVRLIPNAVQIGDSGGNAAQATATTASLSGGKLTLDANGRATKYDNITLAGEGIAPIVFFQSATGVSSAAGLNVNLTVGGGIAPGGLYRVSVAIQAAASGAGGSSVSFDGVAAPQGTLTGGASPPYPGGRTSNLIWLDGVSNPRVIVWASLVIHTDGSGHIFTQFSASGSGTYNYQIAMEKLG